MSLRSYWILPLAASLCTAAFADFRTLVEAKETSTAYMNVPTTENSRLTFEACDECDYISVRLTPETLFYVRGELMTFAEFRAEFNKLPRSTEDYALVSYEVKTNTVKSVRVDEPQDNQSS